MRYSIFASCCLFVFVAGCQTQNGEPATADSIRASTEQAVGSFFKKASEVAGDATNAVGSMFSKSSTAEKETNQKNLKVYSGEDRTGQYVLEGTIYGAAAASIATCSANLLRDRGCLDGVGKYALGGAAVGAFGGYMVASAEEKKRREAEEVQTDLDKARLELAEATVATEAATDLVAQRKGELERLRGDAADNAETREALTLELKDARADLDSMLLSKKRMDAQMIQIRADRQAEADREATEEYDKIIAELTTQRADLDTQIDIMDGVIDDFVA